MLGKDSEKTHDFACYITDVEFEVSDLVQLKKKERPMYVNYQYTGLFNFHCQIQQLLCYNQLVQLYRAGWAARVPVERE